MSQRTNQYGRTKRVVEERREEDIRANGGSNKQFCGTVIKDRLGSVKNFCYSKTHKANASFERKLSVGAKRPTDHLPTNEGKDERIYEKADVRQSERSRQCQFSGSESLRDSGLVKLRQGNSVESNQQNSFPVTQLHEKLDDTSEECSNHKDKISNHMFEQSRLCYLLSTRGNGTDNNSSHVTNHDSRRTEPTEPIKELDSRESIPMDLDNPNNQSRRIRQNAEIIKVRIQCVEFII